jgi:hypothetical protein
MAQVRYRLTINPKPLKVGDKWHVRAAWPSGRPEKITGFKTEGEALDWIATSSEAWLRGRGYPK